MAAKILAQTIRNEISLIKQALLDEDFTISDDTPFDEYYLVLDDTIDKEGIVETISEEYESIISNLPVNVQEILLTCLVGKECMKQAIYSYYEHDLTSVKFTQYHTYIKTGEITPRYLTLASNVTNEFWGKPITLTANCTNIPDGEIVTFYNKDGTIIDAVQVNNDTATITTNLPNDVGNLNFKASWEGNVEGTPYSSTSNVNIISKKHNVTLIRNHSTKLYREQYLRYTLKDTTINQILKDKNLTCQIGDNPYEITTNNEGYAQKRLYMGIDKTYSENCSFEGDSQYNSFDLHARNFTYAQYKTDVLYNGTQNDSDLDKGGCGSTVNGKYYGRWYNHGNERIEPKENTDTYYAYVNVASSGGSNLCKTPTKWYLKANGYSQDGHTKYPIGKIIKFGTIIRHRHYNNSGNYPKFVSPTILLQVYNGSDWITKESKSIDTTSSSFKNNEVLFTNVPLANEVNNGKVRTILQYPSNSAGNPGQLHVSSYYHYIQYIPTQTFS